MQWQKNCENSGLFCNICNDFVILEKTSSGSHTYTDSSDITCNDCDFVQKLTNVTIQSYPGKTEYNIFKEGLNMSGGVLQLTYDDGAKGSLEMTADMVTGFDNTKLGCQSLNISYNGFCQDYDVSIVPGTPDILQIITPAAKTTYLVGEALDQTDLVLTATYEGHGTIDLPLTYVSTIVPDMSSPGTKTVTLTVGDTSISYDIAVHSQCRVEADAADYPESDHNYASNTDETKIFTVPGAYQLTLTFTADTATEIESDYIYLYDGQDNQVGVYSGTQAAGKTVTIPGDTVKIRLVSDESVNKYGYAFSSIVATMTDHVFGDWTVTKEATCSQEGSRTRTCLGKDCSYSETETIPAGHTVANGICTGCKSLGTCGENLAWTLNDGVLTIFGAGNMTTYTSGEAPWYGVSSSIQSIVVEDGVTGIGSCAFQECSNLRDVILPDSITAIDLLAFSGCSSLTEIAIPAGVTNIGDLAFSGCTSLGRIVFTGNAPSFLGGFGSSPESNVFQNVTATACYPGINKTWTSDVMQNYGGNITWIPVFENYAVTLDPQGGAVYDWDITEYTSGTAVQLPVNVTRSGYIFQGWYEDDVLVTEIPADATGDKTYVAKWQEKATVDIDITVQTFDYDGSGKQFVLKDSQGNVLPCHWSHSNNWMIPVSYKRLETPFGNVSAPTAGASTYHQGVDLSADVGTPVYASRSGLVGTATYGSAAGYYVKINHLDGFSSLYMHMTHYVVSPGQSVSQGDVIGYVGKTGVATDYHLHFGIMYNGAYVNPANYIPLYSDATDGSDTSSFAINYTYSGQALNEEGLPYEVGSYSIKVTRPETATHKAVELVIDPAIVIVPVSGNCGYDMTWEFDRDTGTLIISGSGWMKDYSEEYPAPWSVHTDDIRNLDLSNFEASISDYAFADCHALATVTIPDDVYGIGEFAFAGCTSLTTIVFIGDSPWIEDDSFYGVTATAYYPAGWNWYENDFVDYGGIITWVETGVEAIRFTADIPETMATGIPYEVYMNIRPWNATADYTVVVSDPSILEVTSQNRRSFYICAIDTGVVTVTVKDQKSGLECSGEITVVEPQAITAPCSMKLMVPEGDSIQSFLFIPEQSGTYRFSITEIERFTQSIGDYYSYVSLFEGGNLIDRNYYFDGEKSVFTADLNAGTAYTIHIPLYWSAYEQTAVFTAEKLSDDTAENTILRFYQEEETVTFMPGEYDENSAYVDYNGTVPLSWTSSDPSILEITDIYTSRCWYTIKGEGTAVITVSDGILSDSVTITTKEIGFVDLYLSETVTSEENYLNADYAFVAPEAGRYAFAVSTDAGNASMNFNHWSDEFDIMYSYGENSCTGFRTMEAGEVCKFYVSSDQPTCTVRVSKAAEKPLSMKVVTTDQYADQISFGVSFTPSNSCDRVVKWEIDNREIASEYNNPDRGSISNKMVYEIFKAGTLTVTATSESGLKASLTLDVHVPECQDEHKFGEWIPIVDENGESTGKERRTCPCNVYQERNMPPLDETIENRLIIDATEIAVQNVVWIDGTEYVLQKHGNKCYVDLPDSNARTMVVYTYNSSLQNRYPVGMKVWTLENTDGTYTATRQESFDDILQYSGMSIRVTGKKGIRMITSIESAKKNALTSDGLAGYTLKEYGTVIAWASQISETKPLILGASYVKSNYAYKKGIADPVFAYSGDLMQYTNVLVNFSNEQCKNDISMRSYMILEDEKGEELTLYGGIVNRSIGYIAYQNRDVFEPQTSEYKYIWDIIHYVYGDVYDDEFIHAWTPSTK